MRLNSLVIDEFYSDPYETREMALRQEFAVQGNYPGKRTKSFAPKGSGAYELIQKAIEPMAGKITWWPDDSYTGSFQYTTSRDRSWVHADQHNNWAGVLYLTPDAPVTGGTGLFKHKPTGLDRAPKNPDGTYDEEMMKIIYKDSQDMTKWEMVDFIGNKFNKLIMYRGDMFHTSLDYFGQDMHDGRLFQVFFFSTER